LEGAALDLSSVSFFGEEKHETAVSKWARARKRAAKVGKGLSKDEKAQKLALQHWLEAVSPHNLNIFVTSYQRQVPYLTSKAIIEYTLMIHLLKLQIDPRHRYGHNLHFYYDVWSASKSTQPFFYW
jgi:hypothetical protein